MELLLLGLGLVVGYFVWCWLFPFKVCPRCEGSSKSSDGMGNYRLTVCRRCGGAPYPRVGTRFIGRGE